MLDEGQSPASCDDCGLYVDERGHSVMGRDADGRPCITIARFQERPNGEPCYLECRQPTLTSGAVPQIDSVEHVLKV